jgi:hypothetical protein
MNTKVVFAGISALAVAIVLPVASTVNGTLGPNVSGHSGLVADGTPAPPPAPNPWLFPTQELVADGTPAPPPAPNPWFQPAPELIADGTPAPPPAPHPWLVPQPGLTLA